MTQPIAEEEGFTLVEVLVAFAILAGAIVLSFQVFADGLRRVTSAESRIRAIDVARAEIARLTVARTMTEGMQTGTANGIKWQVTIRPLHGFMENSAVRPFRVEVRVNDGENGPPDEPVIETIVLGVQGQP